jgi:haloalkane dehalogenase
MSAQSWVRRKDVHPRRETKVLDTEMSFVELGSGEPIVFLHGNPTSSYLWRNIIPHVASLGRCLAPDLIGMGKSGKSPTGRYRFIDHSRYVDAWFDALELHNDVILVLHDWGSALGFYWAFQHPDRVRAIAYMESILQPRLWSDFPDGRDRIFRALRSPEGDRMIFEENFFVEKVLPASIIRTLSAEEMDQYRAPFVEPESRLPTLVWPRELPIEGEPADVTEIVENYATWLRDSPIPKLFVNGEPGSIIRERARSFCRSFRNQSEVTVQGIHFLQEDSPDEIGNALSAFIKTLK